MNDSGQVVGIFRNLNQNSSSFLYTDGAFSTIEFPGTPSGINDSGQIVGHFVEGGRVFGFFLDTNGSFSVINPPGSHDAYAYGINSSGQIVGNYYDSSSRSSHGFLATPVPEPRTLPHLV